VEDREERSAIDSDEWAYEYCINVKDRPELRAKFEGD